MCVRLPLLANEPPRLLREMGGRRFYDVGCEYDPGRYCSAAASVASASSLAFYCRPPDCCRRPPRCSGCTCEISLRSLGAGAAVDSCRCVSYVMALAGELADAASEVAPAEGAEARIPGLIVRATPSFCQPVLSRLIGRCNGRRGKGGCNALIYSLEVLALSPLQS